MQDVTRTIGLLARPFGVSFPAASDAEADAIALPAARMLVKAPQVQAMIRKLADPVVLTGALVALFAGRQIGQARAIAATIAPTPSRIAPPPSSASASAGAPAAASAGSVAAGAGPTPPPPVATVAPADFMAAAALREQIINGIAHADIR